LGDAHVDLAISSLFEFDWPAAERELKKGLELNPDSAVAHFWYGNYLLTTGHVNEALREHRASIELDPASPFALQGVAISLYCLHRYDDAIQQLRKDFALEPNFGWTHLGLGLLYTHKGKYSQGIAELTTARELMGDQPRQAAYLGYAYALSGNTVEARKILSDFLEKSKRGPFPALAIAELYIGLRDNDRAFEWLQKAIDQKDLNLLLKLDPLYDPLRDDPRFAGLLQQMRLDSAEHGG
jgi:tetratricopeptide (TPR) repeat protein